MSAIDLSYFQEDLEGELAIRSRPKCHKNVSDIVDMISMNRPQNAIELHANLVAEHEQWLWYDKYTAYLAEYETVEIYNNDLPVLRTELDEDGNEVIIYAELKELPTSDTRPAIRTGLELLTSLSYYSDKFKLTRADAVKNITVEVDGMVFDGDEDSQNRMSRAIVGLNAAGMVSTKWKLSTNEVVDVTVQQLAKAMLLSGEAMTNVWFDETV